MTRIVRLTHSLETHPSDEDAFHGNCYVYNAFDGKDLVGRCHASIREATVLISDLVVDPTWRKRGVGRAIVKQVLTEWPKHIMVGVAAPEAREFWVKLGAAIDPENGSFRLIMP